MGNGVLIGLRNLTICELLTDPAFGAGAATYGAATRVPGAIAAKLNPNASNETLFADDGPYETATTVGQIELEINVADLPLELQAKLFGHTLTQDGVLIRKATDTPPWVAVGYQSLKSNGKYRYTWFLKGKFTLHEQNNETKGDSITYNTPTATAVFVRRECDDAWERSTDADVTGFTAAVATNWFTGPNATASGK